MAILFIGREFELKRLRRLLKKRIGQPFENALAMIQKRSDLFSLVRQPHCEDDSGLLYKAFIRVLGEE